jgi:hypothetical protein
MIDEELSAVMRGLASHQPVRLDALAIRRRASRRRHVALVASAAVTATVVSTGVALAGFNGAPRRIIPAGSLASTPSPASAAPTRPVAVSSSSSQHPSGRPAEGSAAAVALCRQVTGTLTATKTTVADVRQLAVGPDAHPAEHAFPGAPGGAPAAWCWTQDSAGDYLAWATTPGFPPVHVGGLAGPVVHEEPVPSGEPAIP